MNELSLSINLPTKQDISTTANHVINLVKEGELSPLETAAKLSALEKAIEQIREGITEDVLRELDKEKGKAVCLGAKIDRREVGVKWTYDNEAHQQLLAQEKAFSERRKEVEKICQNIPEGTELNWTDQSTGETFTLTRGAKTSKTSFAVKLAE